ncbi:aspartate racemase [Deltaproteobacteria bacterium Smac51]|nr:aspartate racemase [Deltaproteobacteria bacterium Smac51]
MKTIGLLGGMSWESTVEYYRVVNTTVKEALGGLHSARILMYSVDFAELAKFMADDGWDRIEAVLSCAARTLEEAGADFIVIGTNTMHKMADDIAASIAIPLFHIADATAEEVKEAGLTRLGLLGTRPTMEMDFYREKLKGHGLEVLTPPEDDRAELQRIIFDELCRGIVDEGSKKTAREIIGRLSERGAEGIILGCTELGMLIHPDDTPLPLFDTAVVHARRAALLALEE